jgi:hypothetical protein
VLLESLLVVALAIPPVEPDEGDDAPAVEEVVAEEVAEAPVVAAPASRAPSPAALIHQRAAQYGVSGAWLERTIWCESRFNPRAVGAAGELGAAQLHPRGLLPRFFALGYTDPMNFDQAVTFTARMFSQGQSSHWTCARR